MRVLGLFDGIATGRLALERSGIDVDTYYASEIHNDSIQVAQHNYPEIIQIGDVRKIKESHLAKSKIDLVIAGSPCKDLSVANRERERGIHGEQSKLFFEFVRVLESLRPVYFLLENVGRMRKVDRDIITGKLGVEPIRINSKLVSAQLRDRLYWTNIPNVSQPNDRNIKLNDILTDGWSDRDKSRCLLESDSRPLTTPIKMFHRYYSTGFTTLVFKDEQHYVDCRDHYDRHFKDMSAREIDGVIDGMDLSVYDGLRYLNQKELERLQTMPEGYTKVLTRDQAASVLGDGWTADIISHILKGLKSLDF